MKSFTQLRNLYGTVTNNTESANLTLGDELINDGHRIACSKFAWPFLEKTATASTETDNSHELPSDCDKLIGVSVTISSQKYVPQMAPSREFWDRLTSATNQTSNIPEWCFVFNNKLEFWPGPSSATTDAISFHYRRRLRDLNTADVTSTTITTLANASTALTVSGGLTAQMAGFFIRPTFSTTANTGDGQWYEIASVASATAATLLRKYQGNSIAAGTAASTISQMPLLPEAYHALPVWYAAMVYFTSIQPEVARAQLYTRMWEGGLQRLQEDWLNRSFDPSIDLDDSVDIVNPNLQVTA